MHKRRLNNFRKECEYLLLQRRSSPKILAGAARKGKVAASLLGVAGSLPAARRQRAPAVGSGVAERCGNGRRHGAARTSNGWRRDGLEHGGGALRRWSTLVNSPASLRRPPPTPPLSEQPPAGAWDGAAQLEGGAGRPGCLCSRHADFSTCLLCHSSRRVGDDGRHHGAAPLLVGSPPSRKGGRQGS